MPKEKSLTKKYRFNQEELKVVPNGKGLAKRYKFRVKSYAKRKRFSQEELKVMPQGKGLAKRYRFSHEKIEGT
jgi:hypothetical protein